MISFVNELAELLSATEGPFIVIVENSEEVDCAYDPEKKVVLLKGYYPKPRHKWVFEKTTTYNNWVFRLARVIAG